MWGIHAAQAGRQLLRLLLLLNPTVHNGNLSRLLKQCRAQDGGSRHCSLQRWKEDRHPEPADRLQATHLSQCSWYSMKCAMYTCEAQRFQLRRCGGMRTSCCPLPVTSGTSSLRRPPGCTTAGPQVNIFGAKPTQAVSRAPSHRMQDASSSYTRHTREYCAAMKGHSRIHGKLISVADVRLLVQQYCMAKAHPDRVLEGATRRSVPLRPPVLPLWRLAGRKTSRSRQQGRGRRRHRVPCPDRRWR